MIRMNASTCILDYLRNNKTCRARGGEGIQTVSMGRSGVEQFWRLLLLLLSLHFVFGKLQRVRSTTTGYFDYWHVESCSDVSLCWHDCMPRCENRGVLGRRRVSTLKQCPLHLLMCNYSSSRPTTNKYQSSRGAPSVMQSHGKQSCSNKRERDHNHRIHGSCLSRILPTSSCRPASRPS